MTTKTDDYARKSAADTLSQLEVSADKGLSAAQVRERLARFGANEIEEREEPLWHRVFRRFWGPIPWMIEAAAILSAVVQKWDDFAIITVMLLVNAGLDFMQEHRALNALKALKARLANEVVALRDGDCLLFYTDGLVDAMDFGNEVWGRERMLDAGITSIEKIDNALLQGKITDNL